MGQFEQGRAARQSATRGAGRRIHDLIRAQIAQAALPPGARAPSTRALAIELGVSRTTVTAAYEQLAAEGFLVTSAGRAARVTSSLSSGSPPPELAPGSSSASLSSLGRRLEEMVLSALPDGDPPQIDFLYGAVAARDFPSLVWRRAYLAELLNQQQRLYYAAPEGHDALRRALQGYLARARGLRCTVDQIVVVNGSQQAIDLCARLLLDAGDAFAFEDPGYLMARRCFEATGATLVPVPVDRDGLDTGRLPRDGRCKLAYVTPSHQFPLGGTLPMARRQALLAWARDHRAWVIEDDYDGEFRYGQRPIDALQAIDTEGRVIYVGTFSKALSPQMRLGYLVLPPTLIRIFRQAKRLMDRHAPLLEQRVLAALLDSGAYERHVRRSRRQNERRRTALLEAVAEHLPVGTRILGSAAGLHVVLCLPGLRQRDESTLVDAARSRGVGIHAVSGLYASTASRRQLAGAGFVVGYASLGIEQIARGIQVLAEVLSELQSDR